MPVEGEIIAKRFRLVRQLGHGSMGSVWLAHHLTLDVPCAVKFIASEAANELNLRARFQFEARTIALVKSPNVVKVLDYDVSAAQPAYIAMEFLEGEDLWSHLQRVRRLDAENTYAIVSQVARGLSRAHAAGVIHRDLKPENVFLAREGDERMAKLLDFGVAKWTTCAPFDIADNLVGTPEYMSPEQALSSLHTDYHSDLWSLAVIAYQCLTGRLPFTGTTTAETLSRIAIEPVPVPSDIADGVSADFDRWWARATSRTIERRFQSASELADALGRALGIGCIPSSDQPPLPERRKKGVRFPASALGANAAIIAILFLGGRDATSVARADLADRSVAAVEGASPARLATERAEVHRDAVALVASADGAAGGPVEPVVRPERAVARSPRPALPKTKALSQDVPKKPGAVVDLGI
jgi:serine/threonine protein kinase